MWHQPCDSQCHLIRVCTPLEMYTRCTPIESHSLDFCKYIYLSGWSSGRRLRRTPVDVSTSGCTPTTPTTTTTPPSLPLPSSPLQIKGHCLSGVCPDRNGPEADRGSQTPGAHEPQISPKWRPLPVLAEFASDQSGSDNRRHTSPSS